MTFCINAQGWYLLGKTSESRAESEARAAKFFLWLCEHLDEQLKTPQEDVFDAGVAVPGEENECEHDKTSPRQRRRRTALLIGHGDFMSLVLKRIVAGFGHWVENQGTPHSKFRLRPHLAMQHKEPLKELCSQGLPLYILIREQPNWSILERGAFS
jgi:hypothetical protein